MVQLDGWCWLLKQRWGKKAIAKNPSLTFNFVWAATWKTSNVFQVRNSASDSAENI